ncbi:hypothetical protein C2G38_2125727 [Gigaspora rosea]|uniref:Uncharacterized protein n=1 Tax=Gigaspora rosea TaxID=44941 RepID=A0A397TVT5_9GLOM|nr:hypothetical protein C2G38_2125727 [Gigaspora rosea]
MDAPSGKALSSQSLSISSSSFFPSPTIIMAVPSGSSNPSSLPTDHSITPTPFRSINTFSTSASIISSTILNSPTEFASPAQNSKTNENLPIIISITVFSTLLIGALLLAYIRTRHKRQRQHALATAIIAAEAGFDDNGNRIGDMSNMSVSPSPSPLPPPTPPSTPIPTEPSAVAINQPRSPPRYKISTLQIEPMTRRLTLNLHQKGKSIVVNDDNDANTDHVVNVVSISEDADLDSDDDDDDDAGESGGSQKKSKKRRFKFW